MKYKKVIQHSIHSSMQTSNSTHKELYVLIDKRVFHLHDTINFNLYCYNNSTDIKLLLARKSSLNEQLFETLHQTQKVYIQKKDQKRYDSFTKNHLLDIVEDSSLSVDDKTQIVYETTTKMTTSIFKNPTAIENVQTAKEIVNPIIISVLHSEDTIASYIKIINYDYYTSTHSLNVSIYALCLGVKLGLDEGTLKDLGRAALLHDLGKSQIRHNIVNKHDLLTKEEYKDMLMHPVFGHQTALKIGIKNKNILDGIRHHHERLDGQGYPDKLHDIDITLFPRIIAVCDVFDALTTQRSYKNAISSYDALHMMKSHMSKHLDMKILDSLISILHK
ncbi:MAG: HD domain-containing protein [Campylobacterota bacterium]|nr:HD domain-containing protein [Campylobacterota bacterium]